MLNAKKGSFTKLVGSGLYDWNSRFRSWYNKDRGEERGRKFYKIIAKLYICNGESSLSQGIRTSYLLPKMTWHLQGHSWILSPWSFSWPYSVWLNVVLYAYLIVNIYIYIYIYPWIPLWCPVLLGKCTLHTLGISVVTNSMILKDTLRCKVIILFCYNVISPKGQSLGVQKKTLPRKYLSMRTNTIRMSKKFCVWGSNNKSNGN